MSGAVIDDYLEALARSLSRIEVRDGKGGAVALAEALDWSIARLRTLEGGANKVLFIGNGGSAGIASHMAIDYQKNGGVPAMAFNDAAALTCLANDLGYEEVFAKQIEMHGRAGDLLIAISSSGRSANIHRSVEVARELGCEVVTLSGFSPDNPLRRMGRINYYVPSCDYGLVEISHLAICHAILDLKMGWRPAEDRASGPPG